MQGGIQALLGGKFSDGALAGFASGLADLASANMESGIAAAVKGQTMTAAEAIAARGAARIVGSAIRALGNPNDPQYAFASSFVSSLMPAPEATATGSTTRQVRDLYGPDGTGTVITDLPRPGNGSEGGSDPVVGGPSTPPATEPPLPSPDGQQGPQEPPSSPDPDVQRIEIIGHGRMEGGAQRRARIPAAHGLCSAQTLPAEQMRLDDLIVESRGLEAGTPEHRAAAWREYQERQGEWSYERWSTVYELNQTRAREATVAERDFHQREGWGEFQVTVYPEVNGASAPRRLDIADTEVQRGVEYKTGYQTRTGLDPVAWTGWDLNSSRDDKFRCRVIHRRRGASHANADGG